MKSTTERSPRIRVRHAIAAAGALAACAAVAACENNSSVPTTPDAVYVQGADTLAGVVGTALGAQIAVRVLDVNLRPVSNASVTFAVSSGATVSPTTATTNDTGLAYTTATLGNVAGMDTLTATIAGASPVVIYLMANAGPASKVAPDSGNQQTASAGTMLPDSLVALVTDQYGNPAANVTVTWSTTSSGTLGATTTQTDANGLTANTYTLAAAAGSQSVVAQVSSTVQATFTEVGQ